MIFSSLPEHRIKKDVTLKLLKGVCLFFINEFVGTQKKGLAKFAPFQKTPAPREECQKGQLTTLSSETFLKIYNKISNILPQLEHYRIKLGNFILF